MWFILCLGYVCLSKVIFVVSISAKQKIFIYGSIVYSADQEQSLLVIDQTGFDAQQTYSRKMCPASRYFIIRRLSAIESLNNFWRVVRSLKVAYDISTITCSQDMLPNWISIWVRYVTIIEHQTDNGEVKRKQISFINCEKLYEIC